MAAEIEVTTLPLPSQSGTQPVLVVRQTEDAGSQIRSFLLGVTIGVVSGTIVSWLTRPKRPKPRPRRPSAEAQAQAGGPLP